MGGVKELRGRIKSVGNIKQITRAMEMVATTKLRRFQDRAVASRPYTEEITALVSHLASVLGEDELRDRPLFQPGEGSRTALLLITSDRGLCGAYNSNVFKQFEQWRREDGGRELDLFLYGRKGYQYLTKRGHEVERYLTEPVLEKLDYRAAATTARTLVKAFLSGRYKDVVVLYTAFHSMVRYEPTIAPLLPVRAEGSEPAGGDVILEPDASTIFDSVVPRYIETRVFNSMLESITSEYASRRVSMKNATDAASDMQGVLKGQYNRLRQETITKELLDIVGGAEALR